MIEIKNVTKTYSGKPALSQVNLTLPRGEIIGLFGENGAGKTTLMKCILGFIMYRGEITLDGESITTKNIAKISFATNEHSFSQTFLPKDTWNFTKNIFQSFLKNGLTG